MARLPAPVAVIDIGSNSARAVVYQADGAGALRVLAGARAALRLVHDVDERGRLGEETMAEAMEALRDFRAIATGAGARRIAAMATAAIRDAGNSKAFISRVRRELSIDIQIIDAEREAYLGCVGVLAALPVEDGLIFDLGGGSMQVTPVRRRRVGRSSSLPTGALRLSEAFLENDPPRPAELRRLGAHVARHLGRAGLPALRRGQLLVGTGGTLRNLARIDQHARGVAISRLNGYYLPAKRLRALVQMLAAVPLADRDDIAGLSGDRADSIVGGALAIQALVEAVEARGVLVSGQGIREGLAHELISGSVPNIARQREVSLASLAGRFDGFRLDVAARRRALAAMLHERLEPEEDTGGALDIAARLLDLGRSVDFHERHEHTADIVRAAGLNGFTHQELALVAAILMRAGDRHADLAHLEPPGASPAAVERAAVLLALADDLEERSIGRGRKLRAEVRLTRARVTIRVAGLDGWRPRAISTRFRKAFGRSLEVVSIRTRARGRRRTA